jgi:hypothetical protein
MYVRETGVVNPQASHCNLVPAGGATGRPPWECHSFRITQLVALCVLPVLLPIGQDASTEKRLKVQTEDNRYQGAPGREIC